MRDTIDFSESITGFEEEGLIQLVGIKLGDEEYAIDVLQIQEIIRPVDITVVPRIDSSILGVMNLRGKVVPVVDLRTKFGMKRLDFDKSTRIIVVNFEKQNVGFVVDVVNAVIRISREMVELTPPVVSSVGKEHILGICKFEDTLIVILDICRVISDSDVESHLRRVLLGKPQPKHIKKADDMQTLAKPLQSAEPIKNSEQPKVETAVNVDLPNPSSIKAPVVNDIDKEIMEELLKRERETTELNSKKRNSEVVAPMNGSSASAPSGSIDDMIALELAKREEETAKLNRKKRSGESSKTDIDSILNDALSQGDNIFKDDKAHVDQDDLDSLIAKELSKREKETEELNKQNRRNEKKK